MPNKAGPDPRRHARTRVVDTAGAAVSTLVNKQSTDLMWICASPETAGTKGLLQVYDGFDAGGELVLQMELGYTRHPVFIPPILCHQGLFIYNDAAIACWTVGYRAHVELETEGAIEP